MHMTDFLILKAYLLCASRGVCVYEFIHTYVIHILLQCLEKQLECALEGGQSPSAHWRLSCNESNILLVMTSLWLNPSCTCLSQYIYFIVVNIILCSRCVEQNDTLRNFTLYLGSHYRSKESFRAQREPRT